MWLGRGTESMGVAGEVRESQLANLLGLGLHPDTREQLGTRYRIYATVAERIASRTEQLSQVREVDDSAVAAITAEEQLKGERQAVAGFDLTFSPVKSVSVAWELASQQVAEQLLAAHRFAVTSTLGWLEDEVITARAGADGIAHVDVTGVTVAGFEHRTSRAGDPDLHTHAVLSNKVLATLHDGSQKWLTLDSRSLYKATVTASERYNRVLAEDITRRLGWRFAVREDQDPEAVSPIRELEFMPAALIAGFSTRRAQVEAGYAERVAAYRLDHGHEPPRRVQFALAQDACLASRPDKDDTSTPDSERREWAEFAASIITTTTERRALHDALTPGTPGGAVDHLDPAHVEAVAARVLDQMEQRRSDWTARHLTSTAHRLTADVTFTTDTTRDREIARIVAVASVNDPRSVRVTAPDLVATPEHLTRRDGQSVWDAPASERFTTHRVLDAEADLLAGAREQALVHADPERVTTVLAEYSLAPDQSAAVGQIVLGDRRLQLLVGPAGTGKTTTMRALVAVWQRAVGGPVSGLAPTAVAAGVLRDETGMDTTATIDLWATRRAHGLRGGSFRAGELVIVDEAGMAGTLILQQVLTAARADGAHVLLVGDPRQLAAIDAGGALRLIQHDVGAAELSTVWRFSDTHPETGKRVIRQWEADASLALRVGDHRAINTYIEHGRVHDGTRDHALDQLYTAWHADTENGRDAIMITGDNATVQTLSARARADRITAGTVHLGWGAVGLRNGATASVGDRIVTRRNDRARLRVGGTDFVKNGDLWTVDAITADGGLVVTGRAGRITLPPDYVAAHVELGYAVTVHRAQGVTVDAAHTLADGTLTRETLYVAATRGRTANHLYCVTEHLLDAEAERPANPGQPALAVLTRALDRTQASESATQSIRDEQHRTASARTHLIRWQYITDHLPAPVGRAAVTAALPAWAARQLLSDPAWPDLGRYLEWVGADHAEQLVRRVWATGSMQRSRNSATVLLTRLAREHASTITDGDWLPRPFARTVGNPDLEYASRLLAAAQDRAAHLGRLAADQPPQWSAALGPVPAADGPDREQWTRRAGYIAAYRETYNIDGHGPIGPRPQDPLQRLAWTHALTALPRTEAPRSQAALAPAQSSPARFRPPSADLPYLHLPNPAERLAAIRADINQLTDKIRTLEPGPGQPGRHERAWFEARGRDLRARYEYLQPALSVRDDAAADLADATEHLQQALVAQAALPNPATTETADGVDPFVVQTGVMWQVESARARVEEARRELAGAEAALDLHAKPGPLSPAGAIVTRTDFDRGQFLASSLDIEEVAQLKHRLDELKNGPLWRAEQAARRHESLSVSPAHIDGVAPPEVGALASITDDQLAALHRAVEQQHASHYATARNLQTALATVSAGDAEGPDTPGPREQRVLRQIQDWNGVLARLRAAATTEADGTSAEQHYLDLTNTQPPPPADDISAALNTAITARAAALHANHGLPEDQCDRDQARDRATAAIATLTSQRQQAADADRDEPTVLTEQLIETAQHLQDARTRLDQTTAELTRRRAADTPATPEHTVISEALIDEEEWHRRRHVTHHDARSNDRTQPKTAQRRIEPMLSVDRER